MRLLIDKMAKGSTAFYWKIFLVLVGIEYAYSAAKDFSSGFVDGLMSHVTGIW